MDLKVGNGGEKAALACWSYGEHGDPAEGAAGNSVPSNMSPWSTKPC